MRDRAPESEVYPRTQLNPSVLGPTLCIAPHPDDEVLGCGGLLCLLAQQGLARQTLILTHGEASVDGSKDIRAKESAEAARRMGLPEPRQRDRGDRKLRFEAALVDEIVEAIDQAKAQTLLLPSLSEPHPDHQAAALAGLSAALKIFRRQDPAALKRVMFYEDGAPMHPNCVVAIDSVADQKWFAIEAFQSQLGIEAYGAMAQSLARLRAFGVGRHPETGKAINFAEAFFFVDLDGYARRGPLAALPQWPWLRRTKYLANDPISLPSVRVLIRSMNRPCLLEALASVCSQSYRPLEIIIANASGQNHSSVEDLLHPLPLRVIEAPSAQGWSRAQAANALLEAAVDGEDHGFAIFLDDDDLIDPQHIERLAQALLEDPRAAGAYGGVKVIGADGESRGSYDLPWAFERLMGINFIPIHAMVFRLERVSRHRLRFDESLPVLEDWDFWRKLASSAHFIHCPGISATYRQGLGESKLSDVNHEHYWGRWHRYLIEKTVESEPPKALTNCLQWHALALDATRAEKEQLSNELGRFKAVAQRLAEVEIEKQQLQIAMAQGDAKIDRLERLEVDMTRTIAEQALGYEREIARLNAALANDAQQVVQLQAKVHETSLLAQHNFQAAADAQKMFSQAQGSFHELQRVLGHEKAEKQLLVQEVGSLREAHDELKHQYEQLQQIYRLMRASRAWRMTQWIRRLIGRE